MGCFYIYLSRLVIAIYSTLSRHNANLGQELRSSSVFICQVSILSIDHTFGSHWITSNHLSGKTTRNNRGSTTSRCTNAPSPKKKIGEGVCTLARKKSCIIVKTNGLNHGDCVAALSVIDRDVLLLPLELLYLREIQISNHF